MMRPRLATAAAVLLLTSLTAGGNDATPTAQPEAATVTQTVTASSAAPTTAASTSPDTASQSPSPSAAGGGADLAGSQCNGTATKGSAEKHAGDITVRDGVACTLEGLWIDGNSVRHDEAPIT